MLDENGTMFTMNNEKIFLKYLGPLLKPADLKDVISDVWTASYYLNYIPLPNGKFEKNIENVILWNMMDQLKNRGIENWENDLTIGTNHADEWSNPSKLCSEIFLDDSTTHYVSAEFYSEPELNITEIIIDNLRPVECQKWFQIPNDVNFENGIMVFKYND